MADLGINQNYYAVSTEKAPDTTAQNHNLATVNVNGGGEGITYYCSAKISIEFLNTEDGTNNLKDKLKAGDLFGKLSSSNNSLNTTFDLSNYVGNKYTQYIDFNLTSETSLNIIGDIYLVNKTSEQNYLSNAKLKANIIIDELECDLKEKELKAKPKLCSTSDLTKVEDLYANSVYTDGTYTYIYGKELYGFFEEDYGIKKEFELDRIDENSYSVVTNKTYKTLINKNAYTNEEFSDSLTKSPCSEIDNEPIISMAYMFYDNSLTTIDLSDWDTSKVTNMRGMFESSSTTKITLPENFGSSATDMSYMFSEVPIEDINLNNMNTSNVTGMYHMFYGKKNIEILDLSSFDTAKVTNMQGMFEYTESQIILPEDFGSAATDMSGMFWNANLEKLDLSNMNTSQVKRMYQMFANTKAKTVILSEDFGSSTTIFGYMFYKVQIENINLNNMKVSQATNMDAMFEGAEIPILDLTGFVISEDKTLTSMFNNCTASTVYVTQEMYEKFKQIANKSSFNEEYIIVKEN